MELNNLRVPEDCPLTAVWLLRTTMKLQTHLRVDVFLLFTSLLLLLISLASSSFADTHSPHASSVGSQFSSTLPDLWAEVHRQCYNFPQQRYLRY